MAEDNKKYIYQVLAKTIMYQDIERYRNQKSSSTAPQALAQQQEGKRESGRRGEKHMRAVADESKKKSTHYALAAIGGRDT